MSATIPDMLRPPFFEVHDSTPSPQPKRTNPEQAHFTVSVLTTLFGEYLMGRPVAAGRRYLEPEIRPENHLFPYVFTHHIWS